MFVYKLIYVKTYDGPVAFMYNKLSVSESIKLWDIKDTVKEIDSVITIFSTLLNVNTFIKTFVPK